MAMSEIVEGDKLVSNPRPISLETCPITLQPLAPSRKPDAIGSVFYLQLVEQRSAQCGANSLLPW
jgi:hypothetical protein